MGVHDAMMGFIIGVCMGSMSGSDWSQSCRTRLAQTAASHSPIYIFTAAGEPICFYLRPDNVIYNLIS